MYYDLKSESFHQLNCQTIITHYREVAARVPLGTNRLHKDGECHFGGKAGMVPGMRGNVVYVT